MAQEMLVFILKFLLKNAADNLALALPFPQPPHEIHGLKTIKKDATLRV